MAGTAKDYLATEVHQGPGDLWVIGSPPDDTAVRLTLDAATLTPDSVAHAASVHLGAVSGPIVVTVQAKVEPIKVDQFCGPVAHYNTDEEFAIEVELAQLAAQKLQRAIGVATYSTAAGYKQATFGGTDIPPTAAIAVIAPKRSDPTKAWVALMWQAVGGGGIQVSFTRSKPGFYKVKFMGETVMTRTAGKRMGVVYETI